MTTRARSAAMFALWLWPSSGFEATEDAPRGDARIRDERLEVGESKTTLTSVVSADSPARS